MKQKSILDINISAFPNYLITKPTEVNLLVWLNSKKYKSEVQTIRNTPDEKTQKILKRKLPAITPSGLFSERSSKNLIKHSGFIQFDIDFKDNQHINNYLNLKNEISNIKEVAYCGLSVRGNGFWGLIPLSNPTKHKQHFEALYLKFKNLGINIDGSCKDIARLRGYSFDDDPYFNHSALKFNQVLKTISKKQFPKKYLKTNSLDTIKNNVEKHLNIIQSTGTDIAPNYDNWFSIGCAIANEFGENGREYFHILSKMNTDYLHTKTENQFNHCLKNKYTYRIATFFHFCKLNNIIC